MPAIKLIPNDYILKKHPDISYSKWLQMVWNDIEWPVVISFGVISLVLGTVGFLQYRVENQPLFSFWDSFYLSLQLFSLQVGFAPGTSLPILLQVARFLSPALAAYALSQAFLEVFKKQLELFWLVRSSGHVVLCGLGRKGLLLVRDLRNSNQQVVVIEQEGNNPYLEICRELGAIVIIGDARDNRILLKAGVQQAKRLIAVCGDDGANVEVAEQAQKLLPANRKTTLICNIHVVDTYLRTVLKERELTRKTISPFRIELFNIYDAGARNLLRGVFNHSTDLPPHLLIIGLGDLGESLIVHAAREWCLGTSLASGKMNISVVDPAAKRKIEMLCIRFPLLPQVCKFRCQEYQTNWPEFQKALFPLDEHFPAVTNAYICFDDTLIGMQAGYNLLQLLHEQKTQIMIRMNEDSGLAAILGEKMNRDSKNLTSFGLLEHTCRVNLLDDGSHETLARGIHEDYYACEQRKGFTVNENPNLVTWEDLSEEIKESNRRQADHIGVKLAAIGCGMEPWREYGKEKFSFKNEEIFVMAKLEHERWCEDKKWNGWKYGKDRDNANKLHPDLVAWDALTENAKQKDLSTVKLIPTLLARAGFQIYRIKTQV